MIRQFYKFATEFADMIEKLEDITGTFKITKEESSSAGVRRIKAVLE